MQKTTSSGSSSVGWPFLLIARLSGRKPEPEPEVLSLLLIRTYAIIYYLNIQKIDTRKFVSEHYYHSQLKNKKKSLSTGCG